MEIDLCKIAADAYTVTVVSSTSIELLNICMRRLVLPALSNVSVSSCDTEPLLWIWLLH